MPIYSERFIAFAAGNATQYYEVPAGKRAVIRCVTSTSGSSQQQYCEVTVAGHYLFFFSFPAPGSKVDGTLRVVAYAGEFIGVNHQGPVLWTTVSGYLFDDPQEISLGARVTDQLAPQDMPAIAHVPPKGSS